MSHDLSFSKVIVNKYLSFLNIEFSFSDLCLCWNLRIKSESLSHFDNDTLSLLLVRWVAMVILQSQILLFWLLIGIKSNASVDQFIFPSFVSFKRLSANLFFSVYQPIFISVVIVIDLPISTIYLNQFLPVMRFLGALIMFHNFEVKWEPSPQN